jgi:hypothetical protein
MLIHNNLVGLSRATYAAASVAGRDLNYTRRNRRHDLAAQKTAESVKMLADRYPDSPMTIRKEHDNL